MKFTDDDLKRFKELDSVASIHDKYGNEEIRKSIPALLARLEAAEKALAQTETFRQWAHNHLTLCQSMPADRTRDFHIHECWEFGKALEAWRAAKGESEKGDGECS